jgi:8-amino-7-oxononanoate synthase
LVTGTHECHTVLERALADWVGLPEALVFSSGYAANTGALSAIAGAGHLIVSDQLNHASIVDGCRLSRARVVVVPHRDCDAIERALRESDPQQPRWVVTESYFSMDGDSPDLSRLRRLCDAFQAGLCVDEAHALGVFGPHGSGLCSALGVRPDVLVGTLGKAVGVQGAFVAGSRTVTDYLWNRARSLVFSTAISPLLAQVTLENVEAVRGDDPGRLRLRELCIRFRELLGDAAGSTTGPIFPILLGTPDRATAAARALAAQGFLAVAIRPPTVPNGTSRLRVSLTTQLTDDDIVRLAAALRECLE